MDGPLQATFAPAVAEDEPILWLMLTYAASMGQGGPAEVDHARSDAYLSTYVNDWGQSSGDLGVVARDTCGDPIGAAWLRLGHDADRLRVGDPSTPELAIGVVPQARGRGVGTGLLTTLVALAVPQYATITLSVRAENPSRRLFRRFGFIETARICNRVGGRSIVMTLVLQPGPQQQR